MKINRTRDLPAETWIVCGLYFEHGIDISTIDDWIEAETWARADDLRRVMEWRQRMIDAFRHRNGEAAEAWGLYLLTLAALNQRSHFLHPLALRGEKHSKEQASRRRDKPGTNEHDSDRNDRLRAFHARLVAQNERDATSQTATEFGVSTRTVQRLTKKPPNVDPT